MTRVIIIVCDIGDKSSGFNRSIEGDTDVGTPSWVLESLRNRLRELGADDLFERDRTKGVERME